MTAKELSRRMDAKELSEWNAYFRYKREQEDEALKRAELEAKAKQKAGGRKWL